ncbi:MAG: hypothetical protein U0487_00095 [Patescibacteria group bacterium]
MDALPAALNELDEGGVIPECEAGDYQAFAQAEQTDMPSDIRAWIDEEFITVFLHNLDCSHRVSTATNSPIEGYVTISPRGLYTLVTNGLSKRFGIAGLGEAAKERARTYLKNPRNLRALYAIFRPQIIGLLRTARKNHAIKRELEILIPYFDQRFSAEIIALSRRQSLAYLRRVEAHALQERELARSYDEQLATGYRGDPPSLIAADEGLSQAFRAEEALNEELTGVVRSPETLQWVLRRQAEGGLPLVRAWGEILKDLYNSI